MRCTFSQDQRLDIDLNGLIEVAATQLDSEFYNTECALKRKSHQSAGEHLPNKAVIRKWAELSVMHF